MALGNYIPDSVLAPARRVGAAVQRWYDQNLTMDPVEREAESIRAEQGRMYDLINLALEHSRSLAVGEAQRRENMLAEAQQREPATIDPHIISSDLRFYFAAAREILEQENAERAEQGLEPFTIQQFADLRGHVIENMTFRQTDLDALNVELAATTLDDDPFGMNLEERGLEFNLSGAHLRDVCFIPATTFNSLCGTESIDVTIEGAVFRGMGADDVLRLRAGEYEHIEFADVHGGTLELDPCAIVRELDVRGAHFHIKMDHDSAIIGMHSDDSTRILTFEAGERARLESADISGATIAPNSQLRGTQWVNVTLDSVNMRDVDFTDARFVNVRMDGQDITYDGLLAAGVKELPASITNERGTLTLTQYENWQQEIAQAHATENREYAAGSPQAIAMEAARCLAGGVAGEAAEAEDFKAQRVIQTQQAREGIEAANRAFAESMATARLHEQMHNASHED